MRFLKFTVVSIPLICLMACSTVDVADDTRTETTNLYVIDNNHFGISNNNTNAEATVKGLNMAMAWAKSNGYQGVRLTDGTYAISATGYLSPPSNFTVDLGHAVLQKVANGNYRYDLIDLSYTREYVTVKGGKLVGDKDSHDYSSGGTHESGYGFCVYFAKNITIDNVEICNMTGDGIYTSCDSIRIVNCNIHDCRRQGISFVGGRYGEIAYNKITKIRGTEPQSGIDMEMEDEINDPLAGYELKIHHNTITDCNCALCYYSGFRIDASNNTLSGTYGIYVGPSTTGKLSDLTFTGNKVHGDNAWLCIDPDSRGVVPYNMVFTNNTTDGSRWGYSHIVQTYSVLFKAGEHGSFKYTPYGDAALMDFGKGMYGVTVLDGGSAFPVASVPEPESDSGYSFDGWYDENGSKISAFPNTVTENLVYSARFK